jgi:peptidoglycan/xylan/chitin deacetylase (PgdA/CDA1 family)
LSKKQHSSGGVSAAAKRAARVLLHDLGGIALIRWKNRRKFRVLTFHLFSDSDRAGLDAQCSYLARHFEPVSLSNLADALDCHTSLPKNAVTVTIDDGYKSFLEYGHPVFRKHRIPTTVFAVSGFSDGRLWLWWDQIEFALEHTPKTWFNGAIDDDPIQFPLRSPSEKAEALASIVEKLKIVPNGARLEFLANLGEMSGIEIPPCPPAKRAPMTWKDMRAVAAEGVEIGCHTATHPILSQIFDPIEIEREVRGAKDLIEDRLGLPVRHFSYPNGRRIDIGKLAPAAAREAGFVSAVTTEAGLNTCASERMHLQRLSFESDPDLRYSAELLEGLHMPRESVSFAGIGSRG